jgi:short-subunit dehydrogenase
LVAGGSQGLGAAFAAQLAEAGLNLVLIARRKGPLGQTASSIRSRFDVDVRPVSLDLTDPGFLAVLEHETRGLEIGLLVCDASHAHMGRFLDAGFDEYMRVLDTNCRAPLALIHHFGGEMTRRGRGGIIVMSSMSAFWGSPFVAVYGATKAFLLNLSEALGSELGGHGVSVTVCAPGPVLTPNYIASKPPGAGPSVMEMKPQAVARAAIAGLGHRNLVIPGALTRAARFFMYRLVARGAAVRILGRSTAAMYDRPPARRSEEQAG